MKRLYRSLAHNYSEGGIRLLARKILATVLQKTWSIEEWRIYEHNSPTLPGGPAYATSHKLLTFDDLVNLGYGKALSFPEDVQRRYSRGDSCHGFFIADQLATLGWSGAGYMELNTNETLACATAWGLFDFMTIPAFQGRGYYTDALRQLVSMAHQNNFRSVWIAVHPENVPSIKGIERAGFRLSKLLTKRRVLGVSTLNNTAIKH
jgi:GNAT superfamily N-acetyltransferase